MDIISATDPMREQLGRELNPTVFSSDEFAERIRIGDHFVSSILNGARIGVIGEDDEPE